MKKLIEYFSNRYLITNVIFFSLLLAAALLWSKIGKEEMPDFTRSAALPPME